MTSSIKDLLLYKHHFKLYSISSQILDMLYPDKTMTLSEIADVSAKPYSLVKSKIYSLSSLNHLRNDGKAYCRRYALTSLGRWAVICNRLNITFLSLCLLSCVYYSMNGNPDGFYLVSSFRMLYETGYGKNTSAVYSRSNTYKCILHLIRQRLVYRVCKDVLKISSGVFSSLACYDKELLELYSWIYYTSVKCDGVFLSSCSSRNLSLLIK